MMHFNADEFENIVSYILNYLRSGNYNRKFRLNILCLQIFDYLNLSEDTRLLHDLGIYGDEAEEFLEDMHKIYQFDYSDFVFTEYFPCEFSNNFPGPLRIFKNIVPTNVYLVKNLYKPISVAYLAKAFQLGTLK